MLVLITGKSRSGKDTVGLYLKTKYGFKTDAFASPVKKLISDVFVLPEDFVNDREKKEVPLSSPWEGFTVRSLLQLIATELFRNNINKDVWALSQWLRINNDLNSNWAITDLRFPNEEKVLSERYNGKIITIKVVRPGFDGKTVGGISGHESESYDIKSDFVIHNDSSIEQLNKQIDLIMNQIGFSININNSQ